MNKKSVIHYQLKYSDFRLSYNYMLSQHAQVSEYIAVIKSINTIYGKKVLAEQKLKLLGISRELKSLKQKMCNCNKTISNLKTKA